MCVLLIKRPVTAPQVADRTARGSGGEAPPSVGGGETVEVARFEKVRTGELRDEREREKEREPPRSVETRV